MIVNNDWDFCEFIGFNSKVGWLGEEVIFWVGVWEIWKVKGFWVENIGNGVGGIEEGGVVFVV